jgi:hypothetical protein
MRAGFRLSALVGVREALLVDGRAVRASGMMAHTECEEQGRAHASVRSTAKASARSRDWHVSSVWESDVPQNLGWDRDIPPNLLNDATDA